MDTSIKRNQKIKSIILISLAGIIIGSLFTAIAFGFDSARIIKGAVGGFLITSILGIFENFVFQSKLKKLKFSIVLIIRTLVYIVVISLSVMFVWIIHESTLNSVTVFATIQSSDFKHFVFEGDFKKILLFSVVAGFLINLFTQINSLLGKNVLLNYLKGKYHNPKEEERIFMFLDLSSSTTIGEKLDPIAYHKFMNLYFFDIDDAIVETKGEIYQYVGDEVVISWKDNNGIDNANCLRCFFKIRQKIDSLSDFYEKEFGNVPGFKAGLHSGIVVTGEIGASKREIVFHGDVLNTASRIQAQCNSLKKTFLASEDVLRKVKLPDEYVSESLGKFMLRGKEHQVELFSIARK